jgi:GxxExxY protein
MKKIDPKIKKLINTVKDCAKDVYKELGPGWQEKVYQQAMEVALREKGIDYEDQRILPISYRNHVVGEGIPDLVIWATVGNKRTAIVIDLKWEPYVKEDHRAQVAKYIQELKKQVKTDEIVLDAGYVINFVKESGKKIDGEAEECGGVQVLNVEV